MCHAFFNDSRFYQCLTQIDEDIAAEVQARGCLCGGVLHSARYPRKPRGLRCALEHGLSPRRRKALIEHLDLWPQTVARWRRWWREVFAASRCWRAERGNFVPPVAMPRLPGALPGRLNGGDLQHRLCLLLRLVTPGGCATATRCIAQGA